MEQPEKRKWDYVLCHACPTRDSENFVFGDDVGKQGVGICPTCGTEIYHVKCGECSDEFEVGPTNKMLYKEFHAEDHTWECSSCGSKKHQPLPTEHITVVRDLPPELEEEFRKESAVLRAKVRRTGTIILVVLLIVFAITFLKLK